MPTLLHMRASRCALRRLPTRSWRSLVACCFLCAVQPAAAVALESSDPRDAAAARAAATPLIASMQERIDDMGEDLERARKAVVKASREAQRHEARSAQASAALRRVDALVSRAPVGRSALGGLAGRESFLARERSEAAGALREAEALLRARTAAAATTQQRLSDEQRRLAALKTALGAYGKKRSGGGGAAFPSYGWGGPHTRPVSAQVLDDYLESKASPMAGHGAEFMRSAYRWDLDPRFVVAIAGAESYFGLDTCASHNAWGWGCPSNPFSFRSWAEGFDTVARGLRENYVDEGRTSVDEIHAKYAPPAATNDPNGLNYAWADNVANFLSEQGGNPNDVRGPGRGAPITGTD